MLPRRFPRVLLQQYRYSSFHSYATATVASSSSASASSSSTMRALHAPLLLTLMACVGFRPLTTLADGRASTNNTTKSNGTKDCPFYGCPLLPTDVHYNTDVIKAALEKLRNLTRSSTESHEILQVLKEAGSDRAATLTLVGYKGGDLSEQINQDRAFVVAPYHLDDTNKDDKSTIQRKLLGVFDGHAPLGELVSEFTRVELPVRLAAKLKKALVDLTDEQAVVDATKAVLIETFIELDTDAPAEQSGGCTATVVLQQGSKVYFANAGDSRSFLVAYRPSTQQASVVYISREDKPNLPDERARVEKMGGQVYIPVRGTSRVVYHDRDTGAPTGLAMSRSIGDWEAGKLGVIPDPIVDVCDLTDVVAAQLDGTAKDAPEYYVLNEKGEVTETLSDSGVDDVHIFAVSATDGMMDYLAASEIARVLGQSLFDKDGIHPVTACEILVFSAANAWQQDKQGRYRDDIAIAVSTLRTPPGAEAEQAAQ